jgi:hypothetical protein
MNPAPCQPLGDHATRRHFSLLVGISVAVVAVVFAAVTNQAWEDYYITYRSSHNLVAGQGLVYQAGERVETFTSPLGVLLPALGLWSTGSDAGALWFFRAIGVAALGLAAALVVRVLRQQELQSLALTAALVLAFFDSKTVSFAVNGMETGLLVFFTALVWHELTRLDTPRFGWLAAGLAGLQWTRPDGFIPALAMLAGAWLFIVRARAPADRRQWWRATGRAVAIGGAVYAPWFLWAWCYYGSPVPQTIIAKSVLMPDGVSLERLLASPLRCLVEPTALDGTFAPAYFMAEGWPRDITVVWRLLARLAAYAWLLPVLPRATRAASFAVFVGALYLHQIMPYGWYYGPWTLLGAMVLGGVVQTAVLRLPAIQSVVRVVTGVLVLGTFGLLLCSFQTARVQQRWIEESGRKALGLWLRENAHSRDTVFLEPLGYIGYFSELKMLDHPGLCAPEVSRLVHQGHRSYGEVIRSLKPVWLVMRPSDLADQALMKDPVMHDYRYVRGFDMRQQLDNIPLLPGRSALEFDAVYLVFQRKDPGRSPAAPASP